MAVASVSFHQRAALLNSLRPLWLHFVSSTGQCEVYAGREGGGQWWNRVTSPKVRTRRFHDIAVVGYGEWVVRQPTLLAQIRTKLAGRMLGCTCRQGRNLPCHAEVLAVVANCSQDEYRVLIGASRATV